MLASEGREEDSIFYKAFLRTGALRRDCGEGDEEIRMKSSCGSNKEWYKTLSQDIPEEDESGHNAQKSQRGKKPRRKRRRDGQTKQNIEIDRPPEPELQLNLEDSVIGPYSGPVRVVFGPSQVASK